MSDKKYTPGPWFTVRDGFSTVYVEARLRGSLLQEVAACGPTEAGPYQQEANANLISCAPELLEMLEKIIEMVGYCSYLSNDEKRSDPDIAMAYSLIAKAKGESQ